MRAILWFSLLLLFFVPLSGHSQYNKSTRDSIRQQYIEEFHDGFSIWPMVKHRSLYFNVRDEKRNGTKVAFRHNNNFKTGAGFYFYDISFEVTFSIPIPIRDQSVYGKSDDTELQINALTRSLGIDLYYQKYSGYYKDDERVTVQDDQPYPLRPDIDSRNLGGSVFYVWNHEKFSLRSAYNYADRQKKSRGSFILYGTINSFRVEGDSAILSAAAREGFGKGSDFERLEYTTFGIAPGYSYNFILKRFFLNGTFAIGPAHHWVNYRSESGEEKDDQSFRNIYMFRVAVGYIGPRFFTGANLGLQSRVLKFEDIRFENSTSVFRIAVGYRFKKKFWKKG